MAFRYGYPALARRSALHHPNVDYFHMASMVPPNLFRVMEGVNGYFLPYCTVARALIMIFPCGCPALAPRSQLHHPNIVHFYGASMVPPNLFYVMELCQRSLFDLLHNCRRDITTRERVKMAVRYQKHAYVYINCQA